MCRRLVYKRQKTACVVFLYLMFYLLLSYGITPEPTVTFVGEEFRVGDKYALMLLVAPGAPPLTDADGAAVFRRCGRCFLTNNKGFLPLTEYDAVLVHGKRSLLTEGTAFMEPGKRYLLEAPASCIRNKLRCHREPRITSFSSRTQHTLCSLCRELLARRTANSN